MSQRIKSLYKAYAKYADILEYFPAVVKYKHVKNFAIYSVDTTIGWRSRCTNTHIRHRNYFGADLSEQLDRYTARYLKYT